MESPQYKAFPLLLTCYLKEAPPIEMIPQLEMQGEVVIPI
jgi:hypothetical protein